MGQLRDRFQAAFKALRGSLLPVLFQVVPVLELQLRALRPQQLAGQRQAEWGVRPAHILAAHILAARILAEKCLGLVERPWQASSRIALSLNMWWMA